jgi:hypothetical protein
MVKRNETVKGNRERGKNRERESDSDSETGRKNNGVYWPYVKYVERASVPGLQKILHKRHQKILSEKNLQHG